MESLHKADTFVHILISGDSTLNINFESGIEHECSCTCTSSISRHWVYYFFSGLSKSLLLGRECMLSCTLFSDLLLGITNSIVSEGVLVYTTLRGIKSA